MSNSRTCLLCPHFTGYQAILHQELLWHINIIINLMKSDYTHTNIRSNHRPHFHSNRYLIHFTATDPATNVKSVKKNCANYHWSGFIFYVLRVFQRWLYSLHQQTMWWRPAETVTALLTQYIAVSGCDWHSRQFEQEKEWESFSQQEKRQHRLLWYMCYIGHPAGFLSLYMLTNWWMWPKLVVNFTVKDRETSSGHDHWLIPQHQSSRAKAKTSTMWQDSRFHAAPPPRWPSTLPGSLHLRLLLILLVCCEFHC